MSDNRDISDDRDTPDGNGESFAARRRVIKGVASAVPVIMTMSSGAALANASSLQCVREPDTKVSKYIGKNEHDGWVRRETWVETKRDNYVKKQELIYVDQWGKKTTKDYGHPVTHSCYNSFLDVKTYSKK